VIVVDTSALVAMLLQEPEAQACDAVFQREAKILISAGTVAEALIVAQRRGIRSQMAELLASPAITTIEVTKHRASLAAEAYGVWGKSFHRAALNFGDCFSYATAREFDCPLLYVGEDFVHTDIRSAFDGGTVIL